MTIRGLRPPRRSRPRHPRSIGSGLANLRFTLERYERLFYNVPVPFPKDPVEDLQLDGFAVGFLLGLLVGEGHFGNRVVVKMHVRHEQTLRWLERTFPGSKI